MISRQKFNYGKLVVTRNALWYCMDRDIDWTKLMLRHIDGDWGDLDEHDSQMNDQALATGGRIFSCYKQEGFENIYIITEADRSLTTILLASDY